MVNKQQTDPNVELAILVVAALVLFFAAISIPISDKKDLYVKFTVQKELLGNPKLTQIDARVQPSTLLDVPEFIGAVWGLQAGDVSVVLRAGAQEKVVKLGDVTSGFNIQKQIFLKNVAADEGTATILLYEGQTFRQQITVVIK